MDEGLFNRIVDFLTPYMRGSDSDRRAMLDGALFRCKVLSQIEDWSSSDLAFSRGLVKKLDDFGVCEGYEEPSLVVLLRFIGDEHGVNVKERAHQLMNELTTPDNDSEKNSMNNSKLLQSQKDTTNKQSIGEIAQPSETSTKRILDEPRAIIIAAVISGIFVIIAALIGTGIFSPNNLENDQPDSAVISTSTIIPTDLPTDTSSTSNQAINSTSTPTLQADRNSVLFTLYRDNNSLTIYVPVGERSSLAGVELKASVSSDIEGYALDDPTLTGFSGLNLDNIQGPRCLRFIRTGASVTPPTVCDARTTNTQTLSEANIFWYDDFAQLGRLIIVFYNGQPVGECSNTTATCTINLSE